MNIAIVGAGRVGQTLAEKLARDGHDVSLIESDSAKVRALSETLDVQLIEGNGATAPILRRAGIEKANLVVAVTDHDDRPPGAHSQLSPSWCDTQKPPD